MSLTRYQKLAIGVAALLVWLGLFGGYTGGLLYKAENVVVRWSFEQRLRRETNLALEVLEKLSHDHKDSGNTWLGPNLELSTYRHISFYVYQGDTMVDWTGEAKSPPHYFREFYRPTVQAWRGGLDLWLVKSAGDRWFVANIPLMRDYAIENAYLQRETPLIRTLGERFTIDKPSVQPIRISLGSGQEICSLMALPPPTRYSVLGYACFAVIIASLLFYKLAPGRIRWFTAILGYYVSLRLGGSSLVLNQSDLYNPEIYAGLVPHVALGDILILAVVIGKMLPLTRTWRLNAFLHIFLALALGIVAQDVVANSIIPIDTTRIHEFGPWSLLTFLSLGIWLKTSMVNFDLPSPLRLAMSTGAVLLLGMLGWYYLSIPIYGFVMVLAFILAHWLVKVYVSSRFIKLLVLYLFSIGSLYVPVHAQTLANEQSKWLLSMKKLGEARDYTAEFLLKNTIAQMALDPVIKSYFTNPLLPSTIVNERIDKIYLRGYLNRFGHEVLYMSQKPKLLSTWNNALAERIENVKRYGSSQVSPGLYAFTNERFRPTFIAEVMVVSGGDTLGSLQLLLEEKAVYDRSIYPHLLLGPAQQAPNYDIMYALYKDGNLVLGHGDLPYPRAVSSPATLVQSLPQGFDYEVLNPGNGLVLLGAAPAKGIMGILGGIGVFFFLIGSVGQLGHLLRNLYMALRRPKAYWNGLSLQNRISLVTTSSVFIMFLLLAYVNLHYFKFKAGDMFSKELMEKTEKAQAAISNLLGSQGLEAIDRDLLYDELLQFSEIHQVDVDFFHVDGNLLGSSQRVLYENGILEPRMDGGARHRLLGQGSMLHLQTERIGKLQYLSAYGPVYGADQMLGVVRLPYFTRNMDVKEEQSTVLVALLNFYVIILLVLVLISAFIARGLARPLKTVALQMRATSLTRKNEKISWAHDDEIGQLVKGYNDMVDELERSAKQLALSKKAEAWQEMAKQVAHEIKNPLTPMKLNIQRLMRASKESHPDFEKILEKVGGVIVDQIDQLSKIASEFSTYAQMPMPKKDNTDMEVLVGQIANLYNTDHTVVYFNIAPGPITLCADRDQLFRALNNLVKNGIQSVPQSRLPRIDIVMERIVGPGLRLSVCDNGTGISEVLADKIFFPNFSTKTSGMGMGLSIVKQIVENHNGTIWHEPNPQGGTIFIIEFQAV